jgi:hypothetical protein
MRLLFNRGAELHFADRPPSDLRRVRRWKFESLQRPFLKPIHVANFVNVVIFRRHPENRHGFDSGGGKFSGELNRRKSFVERICRTTEKPN